MERPPPVSRGTPSLQVGKWFPWFLILGVSWGRVEGLLSGGAVMSPTNQHHSLQRKSA